MADVKPGTKECDRCKTFRAKPWVIERHEPNVEKNPMLAVCADLCVKCAKIVDNAIKRAVRPK